MLRAAGARSHVCWLCPSPTVTVSFSFSLFDFLLHSCKCIRYLQEILYEHEANINVSVCKTLNIFTHSIYAYGTTYNSILVNKKVP